MARLWYRDAAGIAREKKIDVRLRIGRHPSQDIQVLDRMVSKEHAVVEKRGEQFVLFDAGSRNGTFLNNEPVEDVRTLRHGDEVTVGSTVLKFFQEQPEAEKNRSRVTIHDENLESAIRKRLRETGSQHFLPAEHIRDNDQIRRDYEKLRIANELNQSVALEFDLEKLLNKILEKAFEMFAADRGVILLKEADGEELKPAALKTKFPDTNSDDIRISRTILREVMDEKTAVLSSDAMMDSRFSGAHSIILEGIKATMSVPLLYQEKLLGVIHLDSQLTTGAFTEKDLHLLTGFAQQAANTIEHSRLVEAHKKEMLAREQLGRLLPPDLVDQVVQGEIEIKRGGVARMASVMFADIRGFTAMSERLPAQEIVSILNEYFEVMVEIVFRHGGTLDKFIGDEIMAVWGAPIEMEDHASRAVDAGVEMLEALREFNQTRSEEGLEPIHIGIGINSGELVAGYMGSTKAMDYTVVGDVVNTAARLCSQASKGQLIISRDTHQLVQERVICDELPAAQLKGKSEPVPLFRVTGGR